MTLEKEGIKTVDVVDEKKSGDSLKLDLPKYGLDGNPIEKMSGLFSDTAASEAAEAGKGSEQGELGSEESPRVEQAASDEGKDAGPAEPEETAKEPPVEGVPDEKIKYEKLQGYYDKTKQELEQARELAAAATAKALKQEQELEELQRFKTEVAPLISRIKIQEDVDKAIKEIVVPQDRWTGQDTAGNPVASDNDKLAYLVMQKPDLFASIVEKAADAATDKRFAALAKAQVRQSEVNTRFVERNRIELTPKLIDRINAKLSKDAPAIIMNPNISNELKDDIIDRAYEKVMAEDRAAQGDKTVEKTAEEIEQAELLAKENEKRAKLPKSKSGLTQAGRTKVAEGGEEIGREYKEMEEWYDKKMAKSPLL